MRPCAAAISLRLNETVVTRKVPTMTIRIDGTSRKAAAWPLSIMAPAIMAKAPPTPNSVAKSTVAPTRGAWISTSACPPALVAWVSAMMPVLWDRSVAAAVDLDDLRHGDAEVFFHHHDLATGDQPVVHVDVDRLADLAVQFDDGAAAQLQQLADLHVGLAEHGRDLDGNVVDRLQLLGVGRRLARL